MKHVWHLPSLSESMVWEEMLQNYMQLWTKILFSLAWNSCTVHTMTIYRILALRDDCTPKHIIGNHYRPNNIQNDYTQCTYSLKWLHITTVHIVCPGMVTPTLTSRPSSESASQIQCLIVHVHFTCITIIEIKCYWKPFIAMYIDEWC